MAPSKTSRAAHDEDKPEGAAPVKEKARRTNNHHSNGKLQRVASSTGSKLQELTSAAAAASATAAAATAQDNAVAPGVRLLHCDRQFQSRLRLRRKANLTPNSSNGLHLSAKSSTPTDEPTASTHRPPSRTTSANGSCRNRAVSGYTRRQWHVARNSGGRAKTSCPARCGNTSTASASRRTTSSSTSYTRCTRRGSSSLQELKGQKRLLQSRHNEARGTAYRSCLLHISVSLAIVLSLA